MPASNYHTTTDSQGASMTFKCKVCFRSQKSKNMPRDQFYGFLLLLGNRIASQRRIRTRTMLKIATRFDGEQL